MALPEASDHEELNNRWNQSLTYEREEDLLPHVTVNVDIPNGEVTFHYILQSCLLSSFRKQCLCRVQLVYLMWQQDSDKKTYRYIP